MAELIDEKIVLPPLRHDSATDSLAKDINVEELAVSPSTTAQSTIFQIYNRRHDSGHFLITPTIDPKREGFLPKCHLRKKKRKAKDAEVESNGDNGSTSTSDPSAREYFLHFPTVAFRTPPRTIRVGNSKDSPTFCIMHNSFLWRRWRIQIGKQLAEPGVIDGRGCVHLDHDYKQGLTDGERKGLKRRDTDLQGLPLRTWRMRGESGKEYHRAENERRRAVERSAQKLAAKRKSPAVADEVVYLRWQSPFSNHTRRYSFKFRGIDFYWKGTGTVKESHFFGAFVRFNHLKLVARIPLEGDQSKRDNKSQQYAEICLAKFTCSVKANKAGILEVYDAAVERFAAEHLGSAKETASEDEHSSDQKVESDMLYHLVISTAMCMVIGERQKRETIKHIILAAASEGGDAAN